MFEDSPDVPAGRRRADRQIRRYLSSMQTLRRLCVYCGSGAGRRPVYAEAASAFGALLAGRGIGVVFGGGSVGMMGVVADAALAAGGEVIGVIPHGLAAREVGHPGLTALHEVDTMHERKALMAELSDGFVALPGGLGTLEETVEMMTWAQLGQHRKPIVLVNIEKFWDPLISLLDHMREQGFIRRGLDVDVEVVDSSYDVIPRISSRFEKRITA